MGFKVMGFDASGPMLTVGYIDDGIIMGEVSARQPRLAGSRLVAWVEQLSALFGRPEGVAVGIGPGSFTGVRVAVTLAKALAFGWQVPVKGVSSLAAWARVVPAGRRVVVTSERRGPAFYLGYYWVGHDGVEALMPDMAVSGRLPEIFPVLDDVLVLGPGANDPQFMDQIGPRAEPGGGDIHGVAVALEGWPGLQWGKADDPMLLTPQYLRPAAVSRPSEVNHGAP